MGLERNARVGGRSVLIGECTKEAVHEDITTQNTMLLGTMTGRYLQSKVIRRCQV